MKIHSCLKLLFYCTTILFYLTNIRSVLPFSVKLTEAGCGKENNVHVKSADDAYDPFSNRDPTHRTS